MSDIDESAGLPFLEYASLERTDNEKYMSAVREGLPTADCEFQVTEKVHGCNASLVVDAVGMVAMGKRRSLIPDNKLAGFHRGDRVVARYREALRKLFNAIVEEVDSDSVLLDWALESHVGNVEEKSGGSAGASMCKAGDVRTVTVFGEICGGYYPHPALPEKEWSIENSKAVQEGVWYSPDIDFVAFDIVVNGSPRLVLPLDDARRLAQNAGMKFAHLLFRGTFDEALDFSGRCKGAPSTVAVNTFGLPAMSALAADSGTERVTVAGSCQTHDNGREGNVISPSRPLWLDLLDQRVVIKDKAPAFEETVRNPTKGPTSKQARGKTERTSAPAMTPGEEAALLEIIARVTPARIAAVASKEVPPEAEWSRKQFPKLLALIRVDIAEEMGRDGEAVRVAESIIKDTVDDAPLPAAVSSVASNNASVWQLLEHRKDFKAYSNNRVAAAFKTALDVFLR